jgi:hypothetical protein
MPAPWTPAPARGVEIDRRGARRRVHLRIRALAARGFRIDALKKTGAALWREREPGTLYGPYSVRPNVVVRKTAIWPRVFGLFGQ